MMLDQNTTIAQDFNERSVCPGQTIGEPGMLISFHLTTSSKIIVWRLG
jgi:hypothetical protein